MEGVKHLIECHCVLPQYRGSINPIFHKFVVFSVIDDNDKVIPKIVNCNNCGSVHKVTEINRSMIVRGKEDSKSVMSIEDIKRSLPDNVKDVLESYSVDLPTWEEVAFYFENQLWNREIILVKEQTDDDVEGKVLKIIDGFNMKIEPFSRSDTIGAK